MDRGFRYQKRSVDGLRARMNARSGDFDDFVLPKYKKYKPRDGKNLIRILPPTWENPDHYGMELQINYGVGADNQSYLSLSKMKNEADPLAEAKRQAEREGNDKVAKALTPRKRIAIWLIDRLAEDEGPQFWAAPLSVDKAFAGLSLDPDTGEVVWVDDPEQGRDILFYKEGSGMLTKYPAEKMRLKNPTPIHEDERIQNDWLGYVQANPIPKCLHFYDYDHIAEVFNGQVRTEDEEDNEQRERRKASADERPRAQVSRPSTDDMAPAPKTAVADKDEPAPRSRPRTRMQIQDVDPEEEDTTSVASQRSRPPISNEDDGEDAAIAASIRERLQRASARSNRFQADD